MKSTLKLIVPILLIGFSILVPITVISLVNSTEQTVDFDTLAKGYFSNYGEPDYLVIDSQDEWEQIWIQTMAPYYPPPEIPIINFTIKTIITVFFGGCTTGGYGIEITKIKETSSNIYVYVEKTYPPPDSLVAMVITAPFHIIQTKKLTKNVIFETKVLHRH